ncbi:hypothetical protein X777_07338 [Ooceraea biroi]|uniref:Uncharacterized protein n=1 Tax=Ooceraea biroi TaxID=2015173 RepID=A0A026X3L6_OOCBI|nr:hypothetical protein X777_07338 [Ooceraea biroi]
METRTLRYFSVDSGSGIVLCLTCKGKSRRCLVTALDGYRFVRLLMERFANYHYENVVYIRLYKRSFAHKCTGFALTGASRMCNNVHVCRWPYGSRKAKKATRYCYYITCCFRHVNDLCRQLLT